MPDNTFSDLIKIAGSNDATTTVRLKSFIDFSDRLNAGSLKERMPAPDPIRKLKQSVRWLTWLASANLVLTISQGCSH